MSINVKKCCLRVGPRCDVACANITTMNGKQLPWVKELRYLGVYFVQSRHFRCREYKKSFLAGLETKQANFLVPVMTFHFCAWNHPWTPSNYPENLETIAPTVPE